MLERCRKNGEEIGLSNVLYCHGGFLTYEHEAEPADAMVSIAALHHLPDFWKLVALTRAAGRIRDGGGGSFCLILYSHQKQLLEYQINAWIRSTALQSGRELAAEAAIHIREEYSTYDWVMDPLQEPIMRCVIHALNLPPRRSGGLDVGCGIGLQAIMLAEAVGAAGHVTGVDLSPELLAYARNIAEKAGISEQVSFREGNINNLPFDDATFDWVWSANCAGYAPGEPLPLLKELARVVNPGGSVIILAWSSQQLLPGYPVLEAHLNATSSGIAPFAEGMVPELHFSRMMGWFRRAGVEEITARTFTGDVSAPLSGEIRSALTALIEMRWVDVEAELSEEDWAEFRRLCLPESPEFILDLPDYYAFYTYSMFRGRIIR